MNLYDNYDNESNEYLNKVKCINDITLVILKLKRTKKDNKEYTYEKLRVLKKHLVQEYCKNFMDYGHIENKKIIHNLSELDKLIEYLKYQ